MKYGTASYLLIQLAFASATAMAASCPTSQYAPRSFEGEVSPPNPSDVHFSYIADVDQSPDCQIKNIRCILNMNKDDDLWIRWPAADIYHDTPWNRLASEMPALRSHTVPSYDPSPDANAPIEYTQKPIVQPATVYHSGSGSNCESTENQQNSFDSTIQSGIRDPNGKIIDVSIHISAFREGSEAVNQVSYEPSAMTIVIDKIPNRLDLEAVQRIDAAVSEYDAEWEIDSLV